MTAPIPTPPTELLAEFAGFLRTDHNASELTIDKYFYTAQELLDWLTARGLSLSDLTPELLSDYMRDLHTRQKPATIRAKLSALAAFLTFAQTRGYCTLSTPIPEVFATLRAQLAQTTRPVRITNEERRTLRLAPQVILAQATDPLRQLAVFRDQAILALTVDKGLTPQELHRLNVADCVGPADQARLHLTSQQTLRLPAATWNPIQAWLKVRQWVSLDTPALFVNLHSGQGGQAGANGQRLSERSIRAIVRRYLELTGLADKGVQAHILRRTHRVAHLSAEAEDLLHLIDLPVTADRDAGASVADAAQNQ